jgi:hypothetical protein
MLRSKLKYLGWCAGALAMIAAVCAKAAEPSAGIHVGGDVATPKDWTVQQLSQQFASDIKPIDYTGKSGKHTFRCVPLLSVLKASGVQLDLNMGAKADPKTKNSALRFVILAGGRDGYMTVFSLGELLPDIGNRAAWVAIDEDGKALPDADGPARLIVPQDQMPARGVHELAEITVVNLAK